MYLEYALSERCPEKLCVGGSDTCQQCCAKCCNKQERDSGDVGLWYRGCLCRECNALRDDTIVKIPEEYVMHNCAQQRC